MFFFPLGQLLQDVRFYAFFFFSSAASAAFFNAWPRKEGQDAFLEDLKCLAEDGCSIGLILASPDPAMTKNAGET